MRNKPPLIMGKHRKKEIGLIIRKQKSGKLYEDEVMRMTSSFVFGGLSVAPSAIQQAALCAIGMLFWLVCVASKCRIQRVHLS